MTAWKRIRGLRALVQDAVEHGSSAVEKVHLATASRPFRILQAIPPLSGPVRAIRVIHDLSVSTVYGSIRLVNRAVGTALDVALDAVEARQEPAAGSPESPPPQA